MLSDTQAYLPAEVVDRLSAEAFHRLDRTAQRVVEALAIFGRPVIPEAVDFMLQPFEPAIASQPILRRLVGMYLVRRGESGRCFLHPVDQAYARSRIPDVASLDTAGAPEAAYTRQNLARRAAEYCHMIRTDASAWHSIADFGPQLAEFDLLIEAGADTAALDLLKEIIVYLDRWGYRRQIARMAEQIRVRTSGETRARVAAVEADAYRVLESYDAARERYEEALSFGGDVEPTLRQWWALQLAHVHLGLNDLQKAAWLFNECLKQSLEDEPDLRAEAFIGLGSIAERRSDHATAEDLYLRALETYVPSRGVQIRESDGQIEFSPAKPPQGLAITDPESWFFAERYTSSGDAGAPSEEPPKPLAVFVVGKRVEMPVTEAPADAGGNREEKIELFPVQVDGILGPNLDNARRPVFPMGSTDGSS